jgi:hypothetical protein
MRLREQHTHLKSGLVANSIDNLPTHLSNSKSLAEGAKDVFYLIGPLCSAHWVPLQFNYESKTN